MLKLGAYIFRDYSKAQKFNLGRVLKSSMEL